MSKLKNKIAIITQPLGCNYGGLLQNYALQQILLRNHYEVETIDHSSLFYANAKEWLWKVRQNIKHLVIPEKYSSPGLYYKPSKKEIARYSRRVQPFIDGYIHHTKVMRSHIGFSINQIVKSYDAYIVGSDQVWRPYYNKYFQKEMFLNFLKSKDIRRIAYAASFGTDTWESPAPLTKKYASLLKRFNLVTVREESAVGLCTKHFGVEASQVLDPTMLLKQEDYVKLVEDNKEPDSMGKLFTYVLDPSEKISAFIEKVGKETGLKPFSILPKHPIGNRSKYDIKNDIDNCTYPSVTSWLKAFMDAEMVIVDSFHGAVFSIIFNKPFWVVGNTTRGMSRFTSLLNLFNLSSRLLSVDKLDSFDYSTLESVIDWERVNKAIESGRSYSTQLLFEALPEIDS